MATIARDLPRLAGSRRQTTEPLQPDAGSTRCADTDRVLGWKIGAFRRLLSAYLLAIAVPAVLTLLGTKLCGRTALAILLPICMVPLYRLLRRRRLAATVHLFLGIALAGTVLFMVNTKLNDAAGFLLFYMLVAGVFLGARGAATWATLATCALLGLAAANDFFSVLPELHFLDGKVLLVSAAHHLSSSIYWIWIGAFVGVLVERLFMGLHDTIRDDNVALRQEAVERRETESKLRERTAELDTRLQELDFLYEMSRRMEKPDVSPAGIYRLVVNGIPRACRCPDALSARVEVDGREYRGERYKEGQHKLVRSLVVRGRTRGTLEVSRRESSRTPGFSTSEILLCDTVAARLSGLTERKELRERLRQAEKLEAIGQLAGGVAHDFNNLLVGIVGGVELLKSYVADNKGHSALADIILASATRSAELTRQLLAYARSEAPRSEVVDVHAVVGEVVAVITRDVDPTIRVVHSLSAPEATVIGDSAQLHSVFLNLALNARDAMPDGGELVFASEVVQLGPGPDAGDPQVDGGSRYLRLTVTDSGVGMDRQTQKRVFEPFFTTKAAGTGTGLGLASAYGTVVSHNGFISVESVPLRGSTFAVDLPLCNASQVLAEEPDETIALPPDVRVLLVDDHEMVGAAAKGVLEHLGCICTVCAGGREGVKEYARSWRHIDIVLLDVMMPEIDGREAFARMREINPSVRVLFYSGNPLASDIRQLVGSGQHDFIGKPFRPAELARRMAQILSAGDDPTNGR